MSQNFFWTLASAALFVAFLVGRGIAARATPDWPAR
jgi:hypothetical protein